MRKLDKFIFDPYSNEWWIKCHECKGRACEVWEVYQNGRNVNLKLSCGHVLGFTNMKFLVKGDKK